MLGASPSQLALYRALGGSSTHFLAYGGSRSGKTYAIILAIVSRALAAPKSSHAIFRLTFNSMRNSVLGDNGTFASVMAKEFPDVKYRMDQTNWCAKLPNGSVVWFGGLDTKARTEKILGQEHATLFFNEVSQITYDATIIALTRLAQKVYTTEGDELRLRAFYDENPPNQGHWTYKRFIKKIDPITGNPLNKPDDFDHMQLNPRDNPHVPLSYLLQQQELPPHARKRFWDGEFLPAVDNQLWSYELLASCRLFEAKLPQFSRVIVAVDPSGCSGPEDHRSDEIGIVVAAQGVDGHCYVLEDASGRYGPGGPDGWGAKAVAMYRKWQADCIIAERNFGGAMVMNTIFAADANVPVREVTAARGKAVRAEPVSVLYAKGLVHHIDHFKELEDQLVQFSNAGFQGDRSPDRADALVWAISDLAVTQVPGLGLIEWYAQQAVEVPKLEYGWLLPGNETADVTAGRALIGPEGCSSVIYGMQGRKYVIGPDRRVVVPPEDFGAFVSLGFQPEIVNA